MTTRNDEPSGLDGLKLKRDGPIENTFETIVAT